MAAILDVIKCLDYQFCIISAKSVRYCRLELSYL